MAKRCCRAKFRRMLRRFAARKARRAIFHEAGGRRLMRRGSAGDSYLTGLYSYRCCLPLRHDWPPHVCLVVTTRSASRPPVGRVPPRGDGRAESIRRFTAII